MRSTGRITLALIKTKFQMDSGDVTRYLLLGFKQ